MLLSLLLVSQIYVIAHRGEHVRHAENSIAAIQSASELGADYVELDVRTTRDGKLILMHDKTVDRTTNGHGEVKSLTGAEISHLKLKEYDSAVPFFDEALDAAKGQIRIYLDWKDATPQAIFQMLRAHGMLESVVVYGDPRDLRELQKLAPGILVMPEAESTMYLKIERLLLKPKVVAFDQDDFKQAVISEALAEKADIFVDRLGDYDTPQQWQDAIDRGARGIQTDRPAELLEFLREKHLHP